MPSAVNGAHATPSPMPSSNQPMAIDEVEVRRVALIVGEVLRQLGLRPADSGAGSQRVVTLPAFMSLKEIAAQLGISETTAWRHHSSGRLGPAGNRHGGRRLFSRAEVDAWIENGMRPRDEWAATWQALQSRQK